MRLFRCLRVWAACAFSASPVQLMLGVTYALKSPEVRFYSPEVGEAFSNCDPLAWRCNIK